MIKSLVSFIILDLAFHINSFAQEEKQLRNEIGLSFFTVEMNGETLNHGAEPKFVIGPYYNKYFTNLSWISNIEFGINNIDDDCTTCVDDFYGIGKMTELNVASGLRYTFQREKSYPVQPFLESDLCYTYSKYEGNFSGGYSGDGTVRDNSFNTIGVIGRVGLSIYPAHTFSLTVSASLKFGLVKANYHLLNSTETYTGLTTLTPFQLRVGYLF